MSTVGVVGPKRRGAAVRVALALSVVLLCALLIAANFDKAAWNGVQGWGRPYWWLDYHHGLVRRGLVGEVFQSLYGHLSEAQLGAPLTVLQRTCALLLAGVTLGSLALALWRETSIGRAAMLAAVGLWIAVAQFWGTLAYNQGYLDALTLVCALSAAVCVRWRMWWAAAPFMVIGPLIHEYFVFLTPFVLACEPVVWAARPESGDSEIRPLTEETEGAALPWRLLTLSALAAASAAVVTFGANAAATRAEIAAMPLSPDDQRMLVETTLSQGLAKSFADCTRLMFQNPGFTLKNALFFLAPSLVATVALLLWRGTPPRPVAWMRAAAGLFPVAALLLAWDLSRLLVMANFTAGLLFLVTAGEPQVSERGRDSRPGRSLAAAAMLAAVALGYGLIPIAYVYYEPGPATLFPLKIWPSNGASTFGFGHFWANAHNTGVVRPAPGR